MKRIFLAAFVLLLAGYAVFAAVSLRERAQRRSAAAHAPAARAGLRGAYHVHTTASDGRGSLPRSSRRRGTPASTSSW